jgi:hypothetical protein
MYALELQWDIGLIRYGVSAALARAWLGRVNSPLTTEHTSELPEKKHGLGGKKARSYSATPYCGDVLRGQFFRRPLSLRTIQEKLNVGTEYH